MRFCFCVHVSSNMKANCAAADLSLQVYYTWCEWAELLSSWGRCVQEESGDMGVVPGFTRRPKWAQSQICDAGLSQLPLHASSQRRLFVYTVMKFSVFWTDSSIFRKMLHSFCFGEYFLLQWSLRKVLSKLICGKKKDEINDTVQCPGEYSCLVA